MCSYQQVYFSCYSWLLPAGLSHLDCISSSGLLYFYMSVAQKGKILSKSLFVSKNERKCLTVWLHFASYENWSTIFSSWGNKALQFMALGSAAQVVSSVHSTFTDALPTSAFRDGRRNRFEGTHKKEHGTVIQSSNKSKIQYWFVQVQVQTLMMKFRQKECLGLS